MEGPLVIVCDDRERASGVPQELAGLGVVTRFVQLPLGDYVLAPSTAVERKSVRDFVSSLYDGRLFRQAAELSRTYTHRLLLVEGDPAEISRIARNPKSYYGALSSLVLDFGMSTVFAPSPHESALSLEAMARRLTKVRGERWTTMYQTRPKGDTLREQQIALVSSLPGVGPNLARRLLESFGSARKVFTAPHARLAAIHGIGSSRAERIARLLSSPYGKERDDGQSSL
ncbi:MAG: heavy metal resistance protein CzcA [Nitrososphaerota archaeon]|nr:heavy metal resistance protein CzcA [Nitrososphaerota archaeon]MDG6939325.1 heavy metal resistance protein CzcA [Nitrososphaerota archaeon]